ncbi:MAG: VOC family protein [Acidimicrobiales bacterium]
MATVSSFMPCLWFDTEGLDAATLYTSIFDNSRITQVTHYGSAGPRPEGMVMTVNFELGGQPFMALNGGPGPIFSEAVSLVVTCDDQAEVDRVWAALTEGGKEVACGWCQDRFGLSWQVIPAGLPALISDPNPIRVQGALKAMLGMTKIDLAGMRRGADEAAAANGA